MDAFTGSMDGGIVNLRLDVKEKARGEYSS
jgi:hypothetical protein